MRNVLDRVVEKVTAYILCSITFFSKYRAVYEIMSKNLVEPERMQTIWRLRVAYWVNKSTWSKHTPASAPINTPTRARICESPNARGRARTHTHGNMM